MILFMDEDRAYLSWVTHHRSGFVLHCSRKPSKQHSTLHRANCPVIKHSTTKKTHWTTGQYMKVCALDAEQLKAWAIEQIGIEPSGCVDCLTKSDQQTEEMPLHLTKLDQEILSFVLEIAALHLDEEMGPYWLNVGMIAKCLDRTPGQLSAALGRLVVDGLLRTTEKWADGEPFPTNGCLLPTILALKTLPSYENRSDAEIEAEIKILAGTHRESGDNPR